MASITMVLDGIQSLILEVIIKFRPYLWGVQMAYVAGGVWFSNVSQSVWTVNKWILAHIEIGQFHEFS